MQVNGREFVAVDAPGGSCAGCHAFGDVPTCRALMAAGCCGIIYRELKGDWNVEVPDNEQKLY